MSFRLLSLQVCLGVALLAAGGLLVCSAQAGEKERGRPIEFSVPKSDEVTTNLHELTSKKDGLKQLEEDLYKPLQSFGPGSSLEGVAVPPPRAPNAPVIQSKRVKELLERRKNWVFMSPEDMLSMPTVEDVLKTPQLGPDGQEKKEKPALERYYERLNTIKRREADNPMQSKKEDLFATPGKSSKSDSREDRDSREDLDLPGGLRESAQELSKLFEAGSSDSPLVHAETRASWSDTFGLAAKTLTKEQIQEHKKLMDDYHSVVDPGWHPPAAADPGIPVFMVAPDAASTTAKPTLGLPSSPVSAPRSTLDVQMDVVSPQLGPLALPDVNAHALGQTRPLQASPSFEPARVAPVAPTFAAPRRSFY